MRHNLKYTQLMYTNSVGDEMIILPNSTNEADMKNIAEFPTPKIIYININPQALKYMTNLFQTSYLYMKEVYKKPVNFDTGEGLIDYLKILIEPLLDDRRDRTKTWFEYYKLNTENLDDISIRQWNKLINTVDHFNRNYPPTDRLKNHFENTILVPYPDNIIQHFPLILPKKKP